MRWLAIVFFFATFANSSGTAQGLITTVAGSGYAFRAENIPAVESPVGRIRGVAIGPNGDLYFTDIVNNLVLKVDAQGILTIVAGNSFDGFSGDGGPATSARLSYPDAVAVDTEGAVYIADSGNHRVRKVSPTGIITTFAGNGSDTYSGDGGPATEAGIWSVTGLAIDSARNVYIADYQDQRVRKVSSSGIITTYCGRGRGGSFDSRDGIAATDASLLGPEGIAVDSAGNLYLTDRELIRKVSTDGIIRTVAGNGRIRSTGDGGPALEASLDYPFAVAIDSSNNIYLVENGGYKVRKISPDGIITTIAGTGDAGFSGDGGPATAALFNSPSDLAVDSLGNVYVADTRNARVRRIDPSGNIATVAGNGKQILPGDGGFATSASFADPTALAFDASGGLLISDSGDSRVRRITPNQSIATVAGGEFGFSGDGGSATNASLFIPKGVAADPKGNIFFVDSHRVRRVTPDGIIATVAGNGRHGFSGDGGPATQASFSEPFGIAVDASGNLFIADTDNDRIRKVEANGSISTFARVNQPFGLALDRSGNLYASDWELDRIYKITPVVLL